MKIEDFPGRIASIIKTLEGPHELMDQVAGVLHERTSPHIPRHSGALANDFFVEVSPHGDSLTEGNTLHYAPFVHDGTIHMRARPYMTQGLQEAMPRIDRILQSFGDHLFEVMK